MINVITELSKYVILTLMIVYTFHSVGAAYIPPAPPLSKGGGRACEAGGIPAALPFCLPYPFTSFTSFSPLANARAFSIVVMAMLCNAVRVKNA